MTTHTLPTTNNTIRQRRTVSLPQLYCFYDKNARKNNHTGYQRVLEIDRHEL